MLCVCVGYIRVNVSASTTETSRDSSRWRIVGRRTAAVCPPPPPPPATLQTVQRCILSMPSGLGLPPELAVIDPPVGMCGCGVTMIIQGSSITTETGSGEGNKQDSWVEMFTLIPDRWPTVCTNALFQNLASHLRDLTILKHKKNVLNRTLLDRHQPYHPRHIAISPFLCCGDNRRHIAILPRV